MKKCRIILTAFLVFPVFLFSQPVISGKVVVAGTDEPVAGSSVFINSTSIGTVSDKSGHFELVNVPAGRFELIISSIGYETSVYPFSSDKLPLQLKIEMTRKVKELENVIVEPFVEETWEKWGRSFTESFIGTTPNAANCRIKNYKSIRFRYYRKSNRLVAFSDEPLVVENRSLGYTIKYQLEDFEMNFARSTVLYAGYPFFEDLNKNRRRLPRRWKLAREKSYYGSMMDFMRSCYAGNLKENGFDVRRMIRTYNAEKERVKQVYRNRSIVRSSGTATVVLPAPDSMSYYQRVMNQKDYTDSYGAAMLTEDSICSKAEGGSRVLYFEDYLHITYRKETEDVGYLQSQHESRSPAFQQSLIWLPEKQAITIDISGSYYPPTGLFTSAYWGWGEKIAELLPTDYIPEE